MYIFNVFSPSNVCCTENTGFAQSASEYTTLQAEDIPCKHSHDSSDTVEDESDQDDIGDMQFLCDDA